MRHCLTQHYLSNLWSLTSVNQIVYINLSYNYEFIHSFEDWHLLARHIEYVLRG
jgi:hypothetical protein